MKPLDFTAVPYCACTKCAVLTGPAAEEEGGGAELPRDGTAAQSPGSGEGYLEKNRCQMWHRRGGRKQISEASTFGWNFALNSTVLVLCNLYHGMCKIPG